MISGPALPPPDWQPQLVSQSANTSLWRLELLLPLSKVTASDKLTCINFHGTEELWICDQALGWWVYMAYQGEHYLSFTQRNAGTSSIWSHSWLGKPLQRVTQGGKTLSVYQRNQSIKQVISFLQMRYPKRLRQHFKLSQQHYFIELVAPVEQLFLQTSESGLIVMSVSDE